jgi:hypothetical protein
MSRWPCLRMLLLGLLLLGPLLLALTEAGPVLAGSGHRRFYRRAVRLCSRSLSDALYLLCKDRGYNEPFSSSGETEVRHTTGPGLVEECCYNACSIEQMEQYCKPRGKQPQP